MDVMYLCSSEPVSDFVSISAGVVRTFDLSISELSFFLLLLPKARKGYNDIAFTSSEAAEDGGC